MWLDGDDTVRTHVSDCSHTRASVATLRHRLPTLCCQQSAAFIKTNSVTASSASPLQNNSSVHREPQTLAVLQLRLRPHGRPPTADHRHWTRDRCGCAAVRLCCGTLGLGHAASPDRKPQTVDPRLLRLRRGAAVLRHTAITCCGCGCGCGCGHAGDPRPQTLATADRADPRPRPPLRLWLRRPLRPHLPPGVSSLMRTLQRPTLLHSPQPNSAVHLPPPPSH